MTKTKKEKLLRVLNAVIDDCSKDVKEFEGRPFNGKTVGALHGILEAKIEALGKIVKELVEAQSET